MFSVETHQGSVCRLEDKAYKTFQSRNKTIYSQEMATFCQTSISQDTQKKLFLLLTKHFMRYGQDMGK